ncbi:ras-related GTPase [Moesziomyces antarcticus T-34]|uniref:Ras-related GTPase n=1 Tax=Pseudozyma antarctica (strain T-34) TaxID=1151754 RepID=M9LPQ7_PSEA3|nr:ras-related GTPase [Moesziomyces antarcticus T-34]
MATTRPTQRPGGEQAVASSSRNPPLQRLRSGDAVSTLQSSAVAAMGSIRTLASVSSSGTSLHPIAPKRAIKVVLIGDGGCGKTSMRNRFLTNSFFPSYRATIGADFITKTLPIDAANPDGEKATLQIWDTAGQERFQSLGSAFYRGADAVIIALDATKDPDETMQRVKAWYEAFMDKAPGPASEAERKRFCWICAANKVDLVDGQATRPLDRDAVRRTLNALVPAPEGQPDWGIDAGQPGTRPSGAEEPANPSEVLSRPDPNTAQAPETPTKQASGASLGRDPGGVTPISMQSFGTVDGHASPTAKVRQRRSDYRLSRKSLSSVAAAAARAAQQEDSSDADEPTHVQNGGTLNTVYATPFGTVSNVAQLSTSPSAKTDTTSRADGTDGGSGFLSSWMRSRSKASQSRATRGHTKRQSIRSIEVFQPSDSDDDRDARKFAFPRGAVQTPPRSVRSSSKGERPRVDSTMSLGAPSVYHTPRSSTFFSVSPTPRTTLGLPSMRTDTTSSTSQSVDSKAQWHDGKDAKLKHRVSMASSSTASVATVKADAGRGTNPILRTPKSINDLFQPQDSATTLEEHEEQEEVQEGMGTPRARTPSTLSLPVEPVEPVAVPSEVEQGFTLFYTSARTGHNIERMFQHIATRVAAVHAYEQSLQSSEHEAAEHDERDRRQSELIRRTIRIASGKPPDKSWYSTCC